MGASRPTFPLRRAGDRCRAVIVSDATERLTDSVDLYSPIVWPTGCSDSSFNSR